MSIKEYRIDKLWRNKESRRFEVYGTKTVATDSIAKAVDDFTDSKTDRVNVAIVRHYVDESEMDK